jgi:hypothetical protein
MIIRCNNPRCSNTFEKSPRKKYCCDRCRAKHNFSLKYSQLRNNPIYVEKNKIKSLNYYNKNKERLQIKMREYSKPKKNFYSENIRALEDFRNNWEYNGFLNWDKLKEDLIKNENSSSKISSA